MFKAKVVADSVGPNGARITSVEMTYPRFIHAEIMTHRDRARNAASSRAIPWKKKGKPLPLLEVPDRAYQLGPTGEYDSQGVKLYDYLIPNCMYSMIVNDPVIPIAFGKEQKGMQTGDHLEGDALYDATQAWLFARDQALFAAEKLAKLGVHKSLCNRLTEPWMWITVLMTATEWQNFFRLRCHPDAEIHFQKIAGMVRDCINQSIPQFLMAGEWHLPYYDRHADEIPLRASLDCRDLKAGTEEEFMQYHRKREGEDKEIFNKYAKRISAGRCARISYLTQDGKRDHDEDIGLCARLIERNDNVLHASPLEHVCEASSRKDLVSGCMRGWKTFRSEFANENVPGHIPASQKDLDTIAKEATAKLL